MSDTTDEQPTDEVGQNPETQVGSVTDALQGPINPTGGNQKVGPTVAAAAAIPASGPVNPAGGN